MTIDIVTSLADSGPGSLRAVLAGAQAGDTITFATALAGGTIVLASTLAIDRAIIIDGSTTGADITIDGNHAVTDLSINTATVTLQHLVIANGFGHGVDGAFFGEGAEAGGGLLAVNAILTLDDVIFAGNAAFGGNGMGGEFYYYGGTAGGAVLAFGGTTTLIGVSFTGNSATAGDAGIHSWSGGSSPEKGVAGGSAGGAIAVVGGSLVMTASSFTGNTGIGGDGSTATSAIYGGPGEGGGPGGTGAGAILATSATITASDLTFSGNSGTGGYGGSGSAAGHSRPDGTTPAAGGSGGAPGQPGQTGSVDTDADTAGRGGAPGAFGGGGSGNAGGGGGGGGGGYADSNVEITCFLAGTRIRTPGGEIPIEHLAIGDLVLTADGAARPIKWIGRHAYGAKHVCANHALRPVRIAAGAFGPGLPARRLLLSQNHGVFFEDDGGVLVNAGDLVNGSSITLAAPAAVRFFHIELDRHEIVFAEGAPAETFLDADCRRLFANADEYARLYPGARATPVSCAPRLEHGPVLAAIFARCAGMPPPVPPGPMDGQLDRSGAVLEGWVRDLDNPDHPVAVELVQDDKVIARDVANRLRRDLAAAGIGRGRHGYRFAAPAGAWSLRRAADGATLPGAPAPLPPARAPGPLRGHVDRIGDGFIEGWVQDLANPLRPVPIRIVARGRVVARATADHFRADLAASSIGDGRHGYRLAIEPGWDDIRLHRASDGASLPGTSPALAG